METQNKRSFRLVRGERLLLKNEGNKERTDHTFFTTGFFENRSFFSSGYNHSLFYELLAGEFQYHTCSFEDVDLVPVSVHSIVKSFSISSKGSYTTCTYIPFVAIENKRSKKTLFLSLEPTANWKIEVGIQENLAYISAGEIDGRHLHTVKMLVPRESYLSPVILSGMVEGGINEVVKILTEKKRGGKNGKAYPVVFNDYMNCLWAHPCSEKTYPLIDAAADAGAEVFCIDDGLGI